MAAFRARSMRGDPLRFGEFLRLCGRQIVDHDRAAEPRRGLQCGEPTLDGQQLLFDRGDLLQSLGIVGRQDVTVAVLDSGEDGLDPVVIGLWHGIELVVVAAGTANGEAEHGRAGRAHHVVHLVGPLIGREHRIGRADLVLRSTDDEARGRVGAEDVAAELLLQKNVVGFVGIERRDHPVAIGPGVAPGPVHLEAVALGEPDDVEPVPRPSLAVVRRREQPVGQLRKRPGCVTRSAAGVFEGRDLLGRWRQADQVERHAADERSRVGLRIEGEALLRQRRNDEGVDRILADRCLCGRQSRNGRPGQRLKCPVVRPFRRRGLAFGQQRLRQRLHVVGPRGAGLDPEPHELLLVGRERLAVGRHPALVVVGDDSLIEFAIGRLSGHDSSGPGIAAGDRPVALVDPKPALRAARGVARPALRCQERRHLGSERRRGRRISRGGRSGGIPRECKQQGTQDGSYHPNDRPDARLRKLHGCTIRQVGCMLPSGRELTPLHNIDAGPIPALPFQPKSFTFFAKKCRRMTALADHGWQGCKRCPVPPSCPDPLPARSAPPREW